MPVWTYEEAKAKHAAYRGRLDGPKIANHTRLVRVDDGYAVRLHRTDVVTIHPDDTYTLDAGECRTVTTKARLNAFSPVRFHAERGRWFVRGAWGTTPFGEYAHVTASGALCDGPYAPPAAHPAPEVVPAAVTRARARVAASALRGRVCEGHPGIPAVACWGSLAGGRRFYCQECHETCLRNTAAYDHLRHWHQVAAAEIVRPARRPRTRDDVIREAVGPGHPDYAIPVEA